MAESWNGWPLIVNDPAGRAKLSVLPSLAEPNNVRVRAGDVLTVFQWLLEQYARRVEPIRPEWCWGYNYRKIEGTNTWSKHAYALAVDLNAPLNPMGVPTHTVMTDRQISECHALERESDYVLRWGGDFTRPDAMHWEINQSPAAVKKLATKIRQGEAMTPEDRKFFTDKIDGIQKQIDGLRDTVEGMLVLKKFDDELGGVGSGVGNAVLGHGYPYLPGEDRGNLWVNLQRLAVEMQEIRKKLAQQPQG